MSQLKYLFPREDKRKYKTIFFKFNINFSGILQKWGIFKYIYEST